MTKIKRRVFFQFNGFEKLDNSTTIIGGKPIKLQSKNFDKILNLLISKMQSDGVDKKNGYVDISSIALRSAHSDYKPYIQYLLLNGFLERDYFVYCIKGKPQPDYFSKKYRKNKPFGYRFTEYFKQWMTLKKIIFVPISNNNNSDKGYNFSIKPAIKNVATKEISVNSDVVKRLRKDFNSCQINSADIAKTNYLRSKFIDLNKWFYNQAELFKWQRGEKSFTFTGSRLYTNFTRISSHVRLNNIHLNGEQLMCKDISNSFPLMLAIACQKNIPELANDIDFGEYCQWVTSGTFYERLTEGLNNNRNCSAKKSLISKGRSVVDTFTDEGAKSKRLFTKDVVKVLYQIYLNGKADSTPYLEGYSETLINDYMKMKFGAIHKWVTSNKQKEQCVYPILAKEESDFIFNVVSELYKSNDSIKLLTVHDSIYTSASHFTLLEAEWNKQFDNLIAALPSEGQTSFEVVDCVDIVVIEECDDDDDEIKFDFVCKKSSQNMMRDDFRVDFFDENDDNDLLL